MAENYEIRMITLDEIGLYLDALDRILVTSGRENTPFFHAYDDVSPWDREKKRVSFKENLAKKTSDLGWQRTWGLFGGDGKIHGDISLWTAMGNPGRHRAWLGMSMEKEWRGKGIGQKLMSTAIKWAKNEDLSFIDLSVLEGNEPALALYKRNGFEQTGYWKDRWRLGGNKIGEFSFALELK